MLSVFPDANHSRAKVSLTTVDHGRAPQRLLKVSVSILGSSGSAWADEVTGSSAMM